MNYVIDRFEDEYAIVELENQQTIRLPRAALPKEAREGDVIQVTVNLEETAVRGVSMQARIDKLFENQR